MKTYIKPNIAIVSLGTNQTMMAGSANTDASKVGLSSTTADNGSAYSRRGNSFWDDEGNYSVMYP